jgi:hypothetical protein
MTKYPAVLRCGFCGKLWEDCKCSEEQEKDGLKANGYGLTDADGSERL